MINKNSILKSLYDWRVLLAVMILYFSIELFTTPFGGGSSGFPFNTCTHGSIADFQGECNWNNIVLNLFIYYTVSVFILTIIKIRRGG